MQSLAKDDRIAIDGKLDEACWQKRAVKLKLQNIPGEADGKSPDTFVHFTEDQDNFYVAFQCREPEQRLIEQTSKRAKDDMGIWSDNSVEVFLNPKGNRTDYYQIMINSAGSISDQFCKKIGASFDGNKTWDSNAEFKIGFSAGMWTLEMAIPKKSMPGIESGNFCVNFCRTRPIRNRQHYVLGPFVKSFHDLRGYALFLRDSKDGNLASGGDFSMSGAPEKNPYNARSMRYGKWQWNAALPEGAISFDGNCFVTGTQSLKIDLKFPKKYIQRGEPLDATLHGEWLTGARAGDLRYTIETEFVAVRHSFDRFPDYRFDNAYRTFTPERATPITGMTDARGDARIEAVLNGGERAGGMLQANITTRLFEPSGEASIAGETMLYSPELKFYSNKVRMDADLETNVRGLHCLGDSSGWTRGLMMASVMGVLMGRKLIEKHGF